MPGRRRHEKDTFNCSRICVTLRVPQREHYAKGLRIVFRQLRADSVPAVNPRIAELESLTASNERCGNRYTSFTTKEARFLLSELERKDAQIHDASGRLRAIIPGPGENAPMARIIGSIIDELDKALSVVPADGEGEWR